MTGEEMERAIQFLLNHHAQVSADITKLKETVGELAEVQRRQGERLDKLTANVEAMREEMDSTREEMRYGFNKLIEANEVTRRLTEEVAQLALQTSQRVTGLEHRVGDLESKP